MAVRGLTKRYGSLSAVDHLDLTIERGMLYGFLGPNGAGKTTTIRMILGLIHPSAGEVEVLGEPMFGRGLVAAGGTVRALRRVGAIIEEPAAWTYLSGRRNLEYFARAGWPSEDRRRRLARIDEVLRTVGLEQAARKKVKAYSQGMRQRLGIALALLGEPELLVLDEPTNGLDPQGMREVRLLLRRLADGGTTVFVSSHLLWEVEAMCDRVGVLAGGRLVADGPPSKLRPAANRLRIEVDDEAKARAILTSIEGAGLDAGDRAQRGVLRVELAPPATAAALNAALVAGGVAVSALVPEQESLEEVFVKLVEGADVPR
ncbi:MAG TPA: ABC transporter ATP-binding protein [Actinomycetota bacterium]|nr:ABC transporter ATP-binding protein [Actinomycetota bacterium]